MPNSSVASSTPSTRLSLPTHWSAKQRCKNTAIYGAVRVVASAIRLLPLWLLAPLSAGLGRAVFWLAKRSRMLALHQLQRAMPTLPHRYCRQYVRDMFAHLCLCIFELAHLPVYLHGARRVVLGPQARQVFDDALAMGRGVVVVSGHIGNWELLAQIVAAAGYDLATLAKKTYDPRLTAWVDRVRRRFGLQVIWRDAPDAAAQMLRVLRRNGLLAMLIDQDTRVDGVWVPFFGRPAYTPSGAATLCRRLGCPAIVATIRRVGKKHEIVVEPLTMQFTNDRAADVAKLTAGLTARLQKAIVAAPSQWVWLHQRWRKKPPSA